MVSLGLVVIIGALALAVVGIWLLLRGLGHLLRGRPGQATPRIVIGAPLGVGGLAVGLLGMNAQGYARLTYEAPVARISVAQADAANQLYDVTVERLDSVAPVRHCRLRGDDWELSARVQKWKPWANILGLNATYTLDQLTNRYSDAHRANGQTLMSCDLSGPPPTANDWVPRGWLFWILDQAYIEDRHFGSGAYMPLVDGAVYQVVMTQAGLNAEPVNSIARKAPL